MKKEKRFAELMVRVTGRALFRNETGHAKVLTGVKLENGILKFY